MHYATLHEVVRDISQKIAVNQHQPQRDVVITTANENEITLQYLIHACDLNNVAAVAFLYEHYLALVAREKPGTDCRKIGSDALFLTQHPQTNHTISLLGYAAYLGHAELVRYLLTRGANLNKCDYFGKTTLHYAVEGASAKQHGIRSTQREHDAVIHLLIASGADPDINDKQGNTPAKLLDCHYTRIIDDLVCTLVAVAKGNNRAIKIHHALKAPTIHLSEERNDLADDYQLYEISRAICLYIETGVYSHGYSNVARLCATIDSLPADKYAALETLVKQQCEFLHEDPYLASWNQLSAITAFALSLGAIVTCSSYTATKSILGAFLAGNITAGICFFALREFNANRVQQANLQVFVDRTNSIRHFPGLFGDLKREKLLEGVIPLNYTPSKTQHGR